MRSVGFIFLASYVVGSGDWRLSLPWALAFPAISLAVASLFEILNFYSHFPALNGYLLFNAERTSSPPALSESKWTSAKLTYVESGLRGASVLAAPLEDGFFCVPLLLVGLGPVSAIVGGIAFGAAHLARFTYLECLGKALYYALVCYFILPYGLLTVATGHLLTDIFGLVALKIVKQRLSHQSHST